MAHDEFEPMLEGGLVNLVSNDSSKCRVLTTEDGIPRLVDNFIIKPGTFFDEVDEALAKLGQLRRSWLHSLENDSA